MLPHPQLLNRKCSACLSANNRHLKHVSTNVEPQADGTSVSIAVFQCSCDRNHPNRRVPFDPTTAIDIVPGS